ncbi:hypothetical protein HDU97_002952 [Phlyctochytrium planicorne]|nr:hypothetical protein HDU97_002952 [Phlyctochytrium planicorne]
MSNLIHTPPFLILTITILLLTLLPTLIHAHFVLTTPLTRAFNDENLIQAPCGAANDAVNPVALALSRYPHSFSSSLHSRLFLTFPTRPQTKTESNITIAAHHAKANITVNLLYPSPSSLSSNTVIPIQTLSVDYGKLDLCHNNNPPWNTTIPIEIPTSFLSTPKAILQLIFSGPDGDQYQCADVILTTDPKPLPPRTDKGLETIPDLSRPDLCLVPNILATCPNLVCKNLMLTTTSAAVGTAVGGKTTASSSLSLSDAKKGFCAVGVVLFWVLVLVW